MKTSNLIQNIFPQPPWLACLTSTTSDEHKTMMSVYRKMNSSVLVLGNTDSLHLWEYCTFEVVKKSLLVLTMTNTKQLLLSID